MNGGSLCIIMTATDQLVVADQISHGLIENGYAKCIQRETIDSIYKWNNEIVTSKEYRLVIKCVEANSHLVMQYVKQVHNYEVPEIIKINVDDVNEEYLKWLIV